MKCLNFYVLLVFCLFSLYAPAQNQTKPSSINEGSIADQFEFVITKSSNWNDEKGQAYEVVKRNMLQTLKAHTVDTLNAIESRLERSNASIKQQQGKIDQLKEELAQVQETLASTNKEKDSMVFLGMQMGKSSYSGLVWTIIAALLAGLLFFFFRFKASNAITKDTNSKFSELESEYKEHRKNALEREQKIKRQLQDVLNQNVE